MKNYTFLIFLCLAPLCVLGQKYIPQSYYDSLYNFTTENVKLADLQRFENAPQLKMTAAERDIILPSAVNNATRPYMIPIFYQANLECGQASSICYTFTYEILRRRQQDYMWGYDFQYPSHFAWNFCNQGTNRGVSFMESWQVLRTAGTPNVMEWGGWYSYGGPQRWMSGYDLYHSAMKNRISEVYAIPIDDEEGLLTLKHWLSDHLNGEATGGLANFYSTYIGTIHDVLPAGTPEAGKAILTSFHNYVNHAQTIVGYNDSIRWDYNGDGHYTNNIDINYDGRVNLQDWEIGGVIFCNTFGTDFADNGYCYLPYCVLASYPENGGIWNKSVYVPFVKDEVYPQITYKATIRHTSRGKLKLTAGVASDTNATVAEHTMEFSVFNYQGGDQYMQGGVGDETHKTLELGLDVSPLLNYIQPDAPCKFFFFVTEADPNDDDDGAVVQFSLMDYTSGNEVEQTYPIGNVSIQNNTTTSLSLTRAIHFTKPHITDSVLTMDAYTPYRHQLVAAGGKAPYRWTLTKTYDVSEFSASYPTATGVAVSLSNTGNGYATVPLNFDFPFYEDTYNQIVVYADGYISFHRNTYDWPFMQLSELQTMTTRMICPFKADLTQCTVQKISESNCMTLIFNAKLNGQSTSTVKFTVKLFADGTIEYYYGNMSFTGIDFWSAILRGDAQTIQYTQGSGVEAAQLSSRCFRYLPKPKPSSLELSPTGVLSGITHSAFNREPFSVTCYDNNDVATTKMLYVDSRYTSLLVITDIQVNGTTNPTLYSGDTVRFTVSIQNADTLSYQNGELHISAEDPYIRMIDSTEYFGYIGPTNEYTLNRCVTCIISPTTPNQHVLNFTFLLDNNVAPVSSVHSYLVHSMDIQVQGYEIRDIANQNHLIEAEELDTVNFFMRNLSERPVYNADFVLRVEDPTLLVASGTLHIDTLLGSESFVFSTRLLARPNFRNGHSFDAFIDIYLDGQYQNTTITSIIGYEECIKFENGIIPPELTFVDSLLPWVIDSTYSNSCGYSLRSGDISHNDTSTVNYSVSLNYAGAFSFDFKVSTEDRYDYLFFFVDNVFKYSRAGECDWTSFSCNLDTGTHILTWKYIKDYSVNGNLDHVWIDNLCMPVYSQIQPELAELPENMEVTLSLHRNRTLDTTLLLSNVSDVYALFENEIVGSNDELVGWVNIEPTNGCIDAMEQKNLTLHFNSYNYLAQDYYANLIITLSNDAVHQVPLILHILDDTGLPDYHAEATLSLYPNPTDGVVYVEAKENEIFQYQVFDIYGKQLNQQTVHDNHFTIDLSPYHSGAYLLRIETSNGLTTHKIIKR